jgi:ubiquinone/menaquinone biosynthesis C-methylase UbiE
MKMIVYIFLGLIGLIILLSIVWRFYSRRSTLPCPTWLGWLVELDNPFSKINRAATIIEHLELVPGMVVLDVGCGPGRVTIPAAIKIGTDGCVVAMDIQAGMLERVKQKARAARLDNIVFLHAGIGEQKLNPNTFDRALLVTVLGEIPNREAALAEIFCTLKPGGILSITEIIFDPHFQSRSTVRNLARSVGFAEKEIFGNCIAFTIHFNKPLSSV